MKYMFALENETRVNSWKYLVIKATVDKRTYKMQNTYIQELIKTKASDV